MPGKPTKKQRSTKEGIAVSEHLRTLAGQFHIKGADGKKLTKAEHLAQLIWNFALGYNEYDEETGETRRVKPSTWAIHLILDRLEGKVGSNDMQNLSKATLADEISDMTKEDVNAMAESAVKGASSGGKKS
jgi:hypothetical protein